MSTIMEQMPIVFHALNVGFLQTLKLFFVTLLGNPAFCLKPCGISAAEVSIVRPVRRKAASGAEDININIAHFSAVVKHKSGLFGFPVI